MYGHEAQARDWVSLDPDPESRAEAEGLLAAHDGEALADRFGRRLEFGTAGLRGQLGAGPNRMNRVLVRAAAAALAAWLRRRHPDQLAGGVAVGFDARHKSLDYALDPAAVLAGAGITVHLFERPVPTPVLAFAVRHLGAAAGVMVTASHNPGGDNGYKVYDASGRQLASADEAEVSAAIDLAGLPSRSRLADAGDPAIVPVGPEVVAAYVNGVQAMLPARPSASLSIVYSALHGVGGDIVVELLDRAGFERPVLVTEQFGPDPEFPTVAIPNPEEPGVMDLALSVARHSNADLALVNDPDADRLAVAVPDGAVEGGWRALSGDEVGVLLADAVLVHPPTLRSDDDRRAVLVCSVVSSGMLSSMAASAGVDFEETLSGFKWIARAPGPDRRLLLGYEEALGYCVGELVGDKDGISALLAVAQRAAELKAGGLTLADRLDEIYRDHGLHLSGQRSVRMAGPDAPERLAVAMVGLRADPPTEIAGRPVRSVVDYAGHRPGLPTADLLVYLLDGARVVVRPSGTESKLKCYCELVRSVPSSAGLVAVRGEALLEIDRLLGDITGRLVSG